MPLSIQESKSLMVKMFRLALAASERRSEDAVRTFADIVDTTFTHHMPPVQSYKPPFPAEHKFYEDDGLSTISGTSSIIPPLVPVDSMGFDYF